MPQIVIMRYGTHQSNPLYDKIALKFLPIAEEGFKEWVFYKKTIPNFTRQRPNLLF